MEKKLSLQHFIPFYGWYKIDELYPDIHLSLFRRRLYFVENLVLYFLAGVVYYVFMGMIIGAVVMLVTFPTVGFLEYFLIKKKGDKMPSWFGWKALMTQKNFTLPSFMASLSHSYYAFMFGLLLSYLFLPHLM